jgi:hypothetical protein
MGTTLLNTAIKDTYEGLIKTSNNTVVSGTAKYLSDGLGNDSAISISTTAVGVGTVTPTKTLDVVGEIRTSQGILFGTDTAANNRLDDYEENVFTPSIIGSTTDGSASYAPANGNYTKIGRVVHFEIYIAWGSGTGTGDLRIAGLPFVIYNPATTYTFPAFTIADASIALSADTILAAEGQPGTTEIALVEIPVGGGVRSSVAYDAAGSLVISGTYFTA